MKMILDLDTGIDDSMALAYVLGNKEIELIGVVCSYGNVETEVGARNVLNLLNLFHREDVPVYLGESHAMNKTSFTRLAVSKRIHGNNGVGDVELNESNRTYEAMSGIDFYHQAIQRYGKELTIVTTGPLTNLAVLLTQMPNIKANMGKVIVMGGALTFAGNVSPYAEANISQDAMAANLVFESGVDLTMVGLDVTRRSTISHIETQQWRNTETLAGRVLADMVDYYLFEQRTPGTCPLHDPSAAICALHLEYFTTLSLPMCVICEGEAIGRTLGDMKRIHEKEHLVKVCVDVESKKLVKHLNDTLIALFMKVEQAR